jgi:5-(aminomethyl)-3-furanmethanol phosphate kinase
MVETVVKVGGGALAHPTALDAALGTIAKSARAHRLVIVPGGGPFADAVREADRRLGLSASPAHWMATLAMDQYAHLLASRRQDATLVTSAAQIDAALDRGSVPVLAPYRWLRETDPLPHSWEVTSDAISAWIAGELGARQLVLVKPPGIERDAADPEWLDGYFATALPAHVRAVVVAAGDLAALEIALWSPA